MWCVCVVFAPGWYLFSFASDCLQCGLPTFVRSACIWPCTVRNNVNIIICCGDSIGMAHLPHLIRLGIALNGNRNDSSTSSNNDGLMVDQSHALTAHTVQLCAIDVYPFSAFWHGHGHIHNFNTTTMMMMLMMLTLLPATLLCRLKQFAHNIHFHIRIMRTLRVMREFAKCIRCGSGSSPLSK